MRTRTRTVATLLAATLLAFAAPAAAADAPDPWITTRVKIALLTSERVPALDIDVDTVNGRVTLHGFVADEAQKAEAAVLATSVEGVRGVRNLLQARPEKVREQIQATDAELRDHVETVLRMDRALEGSEIRVRSVTDGVVLLGGRAETLSAHRRALEDARSVTGVRSVASEIESPDELVDAEIWHEEGKKGEPGALESARDMWITSKAKVALLTRTSVPALDLNVDTRAGVVTLFGAVPSHDARAVAEARVRSIDGVRAVKNELQVVPPSNQVRTAESDQRIRETIEQALERRDDLGGTSLSVEVAAGVARLSGEVRAQSERLTVLAIAGDTPGVRTVIDDLDVLPAADVGAPPRGEGS